MESSNLLDLSGGDPALAPPPSAPAMKRDQDSLDDFEHLDREHHARDIDLLLPTQAPPPPAALSAAAAVQSFLDTEREEMTVVPPRAAPAPAPAPTPAPAAAFAPAPTAASAPVDHLADKFTDSESEAEPSGESPRRAAPPVPPHAPGAFDSAPASDPISAAAPVQPPAPAAVSPNPVAAPATPAPAPRPAERPPAPPPVTAQPERVPSAHVIEAEVIFCQMGLDAWFNPERLHPKVEALIYWRNPARSGAALGAGLALLLALACCSVVSVLAYASLLALSGTVAFRIYKNILQAVQKTAEGHPFKWLLEADISLPAERSQQLAAAATAHANAAGHELRRLFLVEDLIDSLKFGVVLWSLTYVGACFNGITLIILGYVALFTLPKAYEANKAQVDANLELARAKINEISTKVRAAVPLGKKSESEKDK